MKQNKDSSPIGWNIKKIGDLCKIKHGHSQHKIIDEHGKYPILASGGCIGKTNIPIYSKPSVLIGRKGTINKPQYMETPFWTVDTLFFTEVFESTNPKFLFYIFNSINWNVYNEGSTIPSLTAKGISTIKLFVPPIEEQKRIAEVLSCWDDGIEKLEKVIELKEKQKRGLMQRLLSGKTRIKGFSAPWKQARLGEVGTFSKGASIEKSDLVETGIPCVRYGEIYTTHDFYIKEFNSFISKNIADRSTRIKEGDLLFACSGETAEEIGKVIANTNSSDAYAGGDIIILTPNNKRIFSLFLSYYINVVKRKALNKLGQGYSVVHIYAKDLSRLQICYPSLREQAVIAEVLTSTDNEIFLLKRKCELFKQQKKWLMQQLLTGKKRLV